MANKKNTRKSMCLENKHIIVDDEEYDYEQTGGSGQVLTRRVYAKEKDSRKGSGKEKRSKRSD